MPLPKDEKFKGNEGDIIERKVNNIYFKVKDVMSGFNMDRLNDIIIDKNKCYNENIDYKYYMINYTNSGNKQIKKELYLTYRCVSR